MKKLLAITFLSILFGLPALPAFAQKSYCWTKQDCEKAKGVYVETAESKSGCVQSPIKYNYCFPKETPVKLQVPIGTLAQASSLTQYIPAVYNYLVSIVSIVAIVMVMVGGLRYLTAGGNPSAITSAKETILGAVIGLFLTLGSYTILQTINPALTTLSLPAIKMVAPQSLAQWCPNTGEFMEKFQCGIKYTPASNPKPPINSGYCMGSACEPTKELVTQGCYSGAIYPLADTPHCVPDVIGKLIKALEIKASVCNGTVTKQLSGECSSRILIAQGQIDARGLNDSPTFKEYFSTSKTVLFTFLSYTTDIGEKGREVELCASPITTPGAPVFTCTPNNTATLFVANSIMSAWAKKDKKFIDAIYGPLGAP